MYLAASHGAYQDLRAHFQIILASILSSGDTGVDNWRGCGEVSRMDLTQKASGFPFYPHIYLIE